MLWLDETELVAVDIGEHDRTGAAVTGVEGRRAERKEVIERGLHADPWLRSDVEMEPLLAPLRHQRRTVPLDLRPRAIGRLDGRLLVLIPDQRPSERFAVEAPEGSRTVAVNRPKAWAASEEAVVRLDNAELVAFGVGEHDMGLVWVLTDVDAARTDGEELTHRVGLVVGRRGGEIEMNTVLAGLRVRTRPEQQAEAGRVRGYELDADSINLSDVPAQCVRPKPREFAWRHGVERERDELRRHPVARGAIIRAIVPCELPADESIEIAAGHSAHRTPWSPPTTTRGPSRQSGEGPLTCGGSGI